MQISYEISDIRGSVILMVIWKFNVSAILEIFKRLAQVNIKFPIEICHFILACHVLNAKLV